MNSKRNYGRPSACRHRMHSQLAREVHCPRRRVRRDERRHAQLQDALTALLRRLQLLQADIDDLRRDAERQEHNHDDLRAWTDGNLRHLHIWVEGLGYRIYPKAQSFSEELRRIFPRGFADVPNYRLRRKTPTAARTSYSGSQMRLTRTRSCLTKARTIHERARRGGRDGPAADFPAAYAIACRHHRAPFDRAPAGSPATGCAACQSALLGRDRDARRPAFSSHRRRASCPT